MHTGFEPATITASMAWRCGEQEVWGAGQVAVPPTEAVPNQAAARSTHHCRTPASAGTGRPPTAFPPAGGGRWREHMLRLHPRLAEHTLRSGCSNLLWGEGCPVCTGVLGGVVHRVCMPSSRDAHSSEAGAGLQVAAQRGMHCCMQGAGSAQMAQGNYLARQQALPPEQVGAAILLGLRLGHEAKWVVLGARAGGQGQRGAGTRAGQQRHGEAASRCGAARTRCTSARPVTACLLQIDNQHQPTFLQLLRSSARREAATPPAAIALPPRRCQFYSRGRRLLDRTLLMLQYQERSSAARPLLVCKSKASRREQAI